MKKAKLIIYTALLIMLTAIATKWSMQKEWDEHKKSYNQGFSDGIKFQMKYKCSVNEIKFTR